MNQLQDWVIKGQVYDPCSEFMIIPSKESKNFMETEYKIIESIPSFISKESVTMIYEIGNLVYTLFKNRQAQFRNENDWEEFIRESISYFPQTITFDSFRLQIRIKEIHISFSTNMSQYLKHNGVLKCLSVIRESFLGGREDLIVSLHNSLKCLEFEGIRGAFKLVIYL